MRVHHRSGHCSHWPWYTRRQGWSSVSYRLRPELPADRISKRTDLRTQLTNEYALLKFGDAYWDDPAALKIRNQLNCAISGKMQDICERPPEACYVPDYLMQGLSRTPLIGAHWLSITSTLHNQLIAHIILFFDPVSSFQVLLSEQADCYLENGQILRDFIELPHKGGIDYDKLQGHTGRQSGSI